MSTMAGETVAATAAASSPEEPVEGEAVDGKLEPGEGKAEPLGAEAPGIAVAAGDDERR
jgi:hypothetical protein